MKHTSLLIIILFISSSLFAQIQESSWCGTELTPEDIAYFKAQSNNKSSTRGKISDGVIGVPLTIHIINESDGTGGIPLSEVTGAIDIMNDYFTAANMFFFIEGEVNYIDDSEYFDFQRAKEGTVANANDVKNTVNIYFANTVSASGTPLCGYATFPGGPDRIVMANGCTPNGLTLTHEMGHYFYLFHPHERAFGSELVDGSNCNTAGDLLCSTPADPNLTGRVTSNGTRCFYTGTDQDANGDFYVPDITNIMSYSLDACQNSLTQEQFERMRETLEEQRVYLKLQYESFAVKFDANTTTGCFPFSVGFEDTSIGAFQRNWSFEGGFPATSALQNPTVVFEEPGTYTVSLEVTSAGGEKLTSIKEEYIIVIDPSKGLTRENFDRGFEDGAVLGEDWESINEDPNVSLQVASVSAGGIGTSSLSIPNYNNANLQEREYLVTPTVDFTDLGYVDISFDRAYAYLASEVNFSDTVEIVYRQRCDTDWVRLKQFFGSDLTTTTLSSDQSYTPANNEWEESTYRFIRGNLELGASVQFGIRTVNGNGNNIYIDNVALAPNYELNAPVIDDVEVRTGNRHIIRFSDNSNNERAFTLERSINGSPFEPIAEILRNANAYADENISESGEFIYRLKALGEFSDSPFSNEFAISNTVTSIDDDLKEGQEINIYPNPATERIKVTSKNVRITGITLVNIAGKIIPLDDVSPDFTEIEVNSLPQGLYILQVATPDAVKTFRLAIQK